MREYYVSTKEVEGKKFYYIDFGYETHGRTSFRLWVSSKLVQTDDNNREYIEFPITAKIVETEKGTIILKPLQDGERYYVFDLYQPCGYRGSAYITVLEPEPLNVKVYRHFHSPLGNLGEDYGMLIMVNSDKVKIKWGRIGRTYGAPKEGYRVYYADGKTEEIEHIDLEDLEEIES